MRQHRFITRSLAVLFAVSLAGCGILLPSSRDRAAKNTSGFKSGYTDGCASANAESTNHRAEQVRDDNLYNTDKHYRSGWASGFSNCRNPAGQQSNNPNAGPIPDNRPGAHAD